MDVKVSPVAWKPRHIKDLKPGTPFRSGSAWYIRLGYDDMWEYKLSGGSHYLALDISANCISRFTSDLRCEVDDVRDVASVVIE